MILPSIKVHYTVFEQAFLSFRIVDSTHAILCKQLRPLETWAALRYKWC